MKTEYVAVKYWYTINISGTCFKKTLRSESLKTSPKLILCMGGTMVALLISEYPLSSRLWNIPRSRPQLL